MSKLVEEDTRELCLGDVWEFFSAEVLVIQDFWETVGTNFSWNYSFYVIPMQIVYDMHYAGVI